MSLTVGEHDTLWKSSARSLTNLDADLENIKLKIKLANAREIAKIMYELGEISKEDYVDALKHLWNSEEIFGKFDDVFKKEEP